MTEATDRDAKQIERVLYLYAWMVDKREWGLIDQVFSADATIDYASTGGPGRLPHREALKWLDGALKPWPINLHHITNIMPQVDGDQARCRCYFFAPMGRPRPGGGYFAQDIVTNAGFYHDQLVRTARRLADLRARLRDDRDDRGPAGRLQHPGRLGDSAPPWQPWLDPPRPLTA